MYYWLLALVGAVIGIIPFLLRRQFISATITGVIGTLALWVIAYLLAPSTVWPLATPISLFVFALWVASAGIGIAIDDRHGNENPLAFGVSVIGAAVYIAVLLVTLTSSSSMISPSTYATMIGPVETKNWTTIVQPKSAEHIRMMGDETALYIARKAVANGGTIGSQFSVDAKHMTLQRVNGELVYVVPLDFNGFSQWTATKDSGVPAYIVIDAQDPEAPAKLVKLPAAGGMRYTPGAYFSENLTRYMREHGFLNVGLAEINFELDDSGNVWWVVPTFRPTLGWNGWKLVDVAVVNPVSGEIRRYALDKAPEWIDRIYPPSLVKSYLGWRGRYSGGWKNSFWDKAALTKPEEPHLIYSSDNRAEWVTGITSDSSKDDSLVAIAYTDSRTGKTTIYTVDGGANDEAIIAAVNANQNVNYKKLHGVAVQMYNIYGEMAAVVPLLNASGAYQAVAIASVKNPQDVVIGRDQAEALRNYQSMLSHKGNRVVVSNAVKVEHVHGTVERVAQDTGGEGSPYLFHIAGIPRIFVATSRDSIKVPLTRVGDTIDIDYIASGESLIPVRRFDNMSLPLEQSPAQERLSANDNVRREADESRATVEDTRKRVNDMSDDELKDLSNRM